MAPIEINDDYALKVNLIDYSLSLTSGDASIFKIRRFLIIGFSSSDESSISLLAVRFRFEFKFEFESNSLISRPCPRNVRPPLTCPKKELELIMCVQFA